MAHWRGDGARLLGDAIREEKMERKVQLLIDALGLHFRELEYVLQSLGPENFGRLAIEEIAEEVRVCLESEK